ncbi:hypothetical protein HYC85_005673 [Camellia sinensis]|uniref:Uncharacterized protein n=1 Tax=Camellia sinensis TaxID=4442 RepID=A0A7J7I2T2_CAMSI|nr:hypothetical protein HYC85_005673 [Camellia sinensis]
MYVRSDEEAEDGDGDGDGNGNGEAEGEGSGGRDQGPSFSTFTPHAIHTWSMFIFANRCIKDDVQGVHKM